MRRTPPRVAFWITAGGRPGGGHLSRSMALIERFPGGWETVLVLPDTEYTRTLHSLGGPAVATHPEVQGWSPEVVIRSIENNGWEDGPDLLVIDGMWTPDEKLLGELRRRWPGAKIAMIGGSEAIQLR